MEHFNFINFLKDLFMLKFLPELGSDANIGVIFMLGVLTSFHCVGMCGGIAISQSIKSKESHGKYSWISPSVFYNCGRIISYTIIGALIGGLGRILSFPGVFKGIVPIFGGIFMVIMGINLLNIFTFFRKLNIRMPYFIARRLTGKHNYGPFIVGLLTGLMPCGPLQIIELYALGTRSPILGAASMLFFTLGTFPLLFLVGALNSLLNKKFTNVILKISAVIVILLGIVMVGRGLALSGYSIKIPSITSSTIVNDGEIAKVDGNIQTVTTSIKSGSFPEITVQKGIPVRWTIKVDENELNGCNNAITIPKLGLDVSFQVGDNIVEFNPNEVGIIPYTCWMGMIKSRINVVENTSTSSLLIVTPVPEISPVATVTPKDTKNSTAIVVQKTAIPPTSTVVPRAILSPTATVTHRNTISPSATNAKELTKNQVYNSKIQSVKKNVVIDGMTCEKCVEHIKNALEKIDGVEIIDVSIGHARINLNKDVSDDDIKNAIENAGYKLTSIDNN